MRIKVGRDGFRLFTYLREGKCRGVKEEERVG